MQFETRRQGNILVLTLLEDLTFQKNEEFGSLLHEIVRESHADIVVDMTAVNRIDSMVAGHFVAARRECELKRRHFGLANVPEGTKQILHSGGAAHQIHVYDSIPEAIADLSDRAHGTQSRRLVMDIKCGHDDCVYYTFGKQPGFVVPACEYPYQDDITNGPTCKCYKPDWKQIQENLPMSGPSPFRSAKKKSLYEVRDKAAREMSGDSDPGFEHPDMDGSEPDRTGSDLDVAASSNSTQQTGAARLNHPDYVPKIATAQERTRPTVAEATDWETLEEPFISDDPFAVDNFPSSRTQEPPPPPPPMAEAAPPKPEPKPEPPAPESPPPEETPEQVVKSYIHAWNEGDFQKEYRCLASRNRAFTEADYVTRRQSLRTSQMQRHAGKPTQQEVARVDSCAVDGIHSTVEITRVDRTPSGSVCYAQHFHLVLEKGFWRIQRSEDGETRKNPVKPQKGRVMKAGDFLGKSK